MLLRSVTKHVNDQNWFAVFLDLMIVVIGVFIGIEVSNWNADRAGDKKAQVLIKRLYGDLINDSDVMNILLNYHAVVRNYAITAIDGFNGKKTVNDEQFVIAAYQASQIAGPWGYRSTYNELLSTGHFDLIKSDELKGQILGYYSEDWSRQSALITTTAYREYIRGTIPFLIQDAIRGECGDIPVPVAHSFGNVLPDTCDLQLPDEIFSETAAHLRSQPDMLHNLQYQLSSYESQVYTLTNYEKEAQTLMTAIREFQQ